MSGKNSALDDFMLACSDLSGSSRRQGFKGPPVKDIRREAPKQVFQTSNKSRDWRAFDQNLENAFGAPSQMQQLAPLAPANVQPTLAPARFQPVNAHASDVGDDWGDFQAFSGSGPTSAPPAPVDQSQSIGCRLASLQDESPVHRFRNVQLTAAPVAHPIQSQIKTLQPQQASMQLQMSSNLGQSSMSQNKNHMFPQSKSEPNSLLDLDDDDFGDFASPVSVVGVQPPVPSVPAVSPLTKPKSFSTTFPIDQPLQSLNVVNTFPIDQPIQISKSFVIDKPVAVKGTFSIDEPILPSPLLQTNSIPPAPNMFQTPSISPNSLPAPAAAPIIAPKATGLGKGLSMDKYSALRDLLGEDNDKSHPSEIVSPNPATGIPEAAQTIQMSMVSNNASEDDFGDFVEFSAPSNPIQNTQTFHQPAFPSLGNIYKANPPSSQQLNFPTLLPSPTSTSNTDQDFPDEWSLPPATTKSPNLPPPISSVFTMKAEESNKFEGFDLVKPKDEDEEFDEWSLPVSTGMEMPSQGIAQFPYRPAAAPLPFLSSSPPPPMTLVSSPPPADNEEFSLPSEQFGFSDQEIFGVKKPKQNKSQKPQSIQDVIGQSLKNKPKTESQIETPTLLSNNTDAAEGQKSSSCSPSPDPGLVPVNKSPESQSVLSLELGVDVDVAEAHVSSENTNDADNKVEGVETLAVDVNDDTLITVYSEWVQILSQIKVLFETVRSTFDEILYEDLKEELITHEKGKAYLENFTEVFKVYKRILQSYKLKISMNSCPSSDGKKLDQLIMDIETCWRRMEEHCQDYNPLSKLITSDSTGQGQGVCGVCLLSGAELKHGDSYYHPGCANYWVNCVRDVLPSLEKI